MKCYFCDIETNSDISDSVNNVPSWINYTCPKCKTIYEYDCTSSGLYGYNFHVDEYYCWFYSLDTKFCLDKLVLNVGDPTQGSHFVEVLELNFHPDITPYNLKEKVSKLLAFI
jgi:hypothetical protein